ncbi:nicotinamide riboside transporter PnuC [Ramlibacter tataouinensis]|uniref:nicotinamide riboside transporter PnuC n=1 Tax=Ramlibacter tataouinensis TaxID=94132 RepID=UPI0022F39495|nr:nicotinamide riboside transporter PnuC [Ramlibacter tataouinensis]WBY02731.1 nicotinamide riboside transporter PnuC [Ramlibacter tataouinensis]
MPEFLFLSAFDLGGSPVTWLELVAVVLSLAMVGFNIREIHWGWPLAIGASLLYFLLFWRHRLYGEAWLQIVFAVVGLWGWLQWLRGKGRDGAPLRVHRLSPAGWAVSLLALAIAWPALGWVLRSWTDTDVPWWDAFPTSLSLVGQVLLGRKLLENWLAWIVVNAVSVALFAYKSLWLTAGLYVVFILLSIVGWRAWRARVAA